MKALTWHGKRDVRVEHVPDPGIREPDDVIIRVTSTGVCGSDLHLYEVMAGFMGEGDILGHEPMGIVEEVGPEVRGGVGRRPRRRPVQHLVRPLLDVLAGSALTVRDDAAARPGHRRRALRLHEALRPGVGRPGGVPPRSVREHAADQGARRPAGRPLPVPLRRAADGVAGGGVRERARRGTLLVLGLGPIGEMATRVGQHRGYRVLGVDLVPDRLDRARSHGVEVLDLREHDDDLVDVVRGMTDGRGPDSVIDAVGMEAHGSPVAKGVQVATALLPRTLQAKIMEKAGLDRLHALRLAIDLVRRGGTISLAGVYGGMADPLPMMTLFDKQIQLRMGQANVLRWVPEIMPLLMDGDPLGAESYATHHVSLDEAPAAYERFQKKEDGTFKVVINP